MKKILSFCKPALWLAIICYGLFIPANELPVKPFLSIPHFDKMVHFSLFFGLNVLLMRPIKNLTSKYYFIATAISISLGMILEYEQHFITASRHTDIYDFFANLTGIIVAVFFYRFFVSGRKWEQLF